MKVRDSEKVDDEIVEYLEVKQQILLSYCINVVFYLYMKVLFTSAFFLTRWFPGYK